MDNYVTTEGRIRQEYIDPQQEYLKKDTMKNRFDAYNLKITEIIEDILSFKYHRENIFKA